VGKHFFLKIFFFSPKAAASPPPPEGTAKPTYKRAFEHILPVAKEYN